MCVIVIGYILVYGIEQNVESTITTVETQTFPLVNWHETHEQWFEITKTYETMINASLPPTKVRNGVFSPSRTYFWWVCVCRFWPLAFGHVGACAEAPISSKTRLSEWMSVSSRARLRLRVRLELTVSFCEDSRWRVGARGSEPVSCWSAQPRFWGKCLNLSTNVRWRFSRSCDRPKQWPDGQKGFLIVTNRLVLVFRVPTQSTTCRYEISRPHDSPGGSSQRAW